MVTVVTTKELEAGDVLRRFKAEAAQHEPHGGNTNNRYVLRPVFGNCIAAHAILVPHFGAFLFYPRKLGTTAIFSTHAHKYIHIHTYTHTHISISHAHTDTHATHARLC